MSTARSGGFSFNFIPEELCTDEDPTAEKETAGDGTVETKPPEPPKKAPPPRLAFAWIRNIDALLSERAQQEIVFTDIPIFPDKSSKEHPHHQQQQQPALLRCVDLTRSSFRRKRALSFNKNDDEEEDDVWKHTDIQTGVYEGGRKVWECSLDLLHYMVQENITIQAAAAAAARRAAVSTEKAAVAKTFFALELGCGHGLPGCYLLKKALQYNADDEYWQQQQQQNWTVVFTDYNDSVITDATLSNIVLNTASSVDDDEMKAAVAQHVVLGAGDWLEMSKQLLQGCNDDDDDYNDETSNCSNHTKPFLPADGKFDLILAAETIYSKDAARETALFLQRHLRRGTGVAYIATKRYYFGVGGGVDAFRSFAAAAEEEEEEEVSSCCRLLVETVRVHDNGTGNIREVLRVRCMPSSSA